MEKYTRLLSSKHNHRIFFLIFLNIIAIFFETVGIALIPVFISILIDPNALNLLPFGFIEPVLKELGYENIAKYGALFLIILLAINGHEFIGHKLISFIILSFMSFILST